MNGRLQRDDSAPSLQRFLGGFQEANDAQAGLAVVRGCRAVENAIDKISELERQRLGRIDFGSPHIARPIADQEIGRASCRESVDLGGRRIIKKKKKKKRK